MFKVNLIDIPDYQYYLACNAKKIGPPNFPRKKVNISIEKVLFSKKVFQSEISDFFAHSIFKIIEFL